MGQYHYTVNLDKRQFINPHALGDGLKLLEQCGWSPGGVNDALHMLLAVSSGRGGGDFQGDDPLIGSWGGDRIAVVGDYAEDGDLPEEFQASKIYGWCSDDTNEGWQDITPQLVALMEREYELVYWGDGWKQRAEVSDLIEKFTGTHGVGDRTAEIDGKSYKMSGVLKALRAKLSGSEYRRRDDQKFTASDLGLKPIKRETTSK